MAIEVTIPQMGESVAEVMLLQWLKADGEPVARDEPVCVLETDKANVDLPAPAAGIIRHRRAVGDTLAVGDVLASIEDAAAGAPAEVPVVPDEPAEAVTASLTPAAAGDDGPAVRRLLAEHGLDAGAITGSGKGGRLTTDDVLNHLEQRQAATKATPAAVPPADVAAPPVAAPAAAAVPAPPPPAAVAPVVVTKAPSPPKAGPAAPARPSPPVLPTPAAAASAPAVDGVRRVPMPRLRQRIAEHLVAAQHTAAMLTTFNEVDMSAVMALRTRYKERFSEVHGVGLGFMSFFSRAVVQGLAEFPSINAFIEGTDMVFHDYVNLGIAVSTDRGLVVPVLQHAETMSLARIETEIKRLAQGARDNRLSLDDLSGGTFTITNGGVFGSLLSTPILNAPQSGILGMHAIQQRPVAVDGRVEIRPMMYVALSYDHRLVDGQQSVSFLVRVKQLLEDPSRLLLQI